jgi:hypothetical protein
VKVTLKIGRLNTQPEFWWFCDRNGLPTAYVFPVREFPTPASVLKVLQDGPGKWDFTSALHPAKQWRIPLSLAIHK